MNNICNEEEITGASEQYSDFIDSLDEICLHNLGNAMEAMEVDIREERKKIWRKFSTK